VARILSNSQTCHRRQLAFLSTAVRHPTILPRTRPSPAHVAMSRPTSPSSDGSIPQDAGIDLSAALRRLGGDAELLREMALIVVQDMPELLVQACSGLMSDDLEPAARAAHSLKGLAANFSEPAARAAQEAETAIRSGNADQAGMALVTLERFIARLIAELQRTVIDK
jgi:HPt (histidine-containing phosphotransfer) domain-containing protein